MTTTRNARQRILTLGIWCSAISAASAGPLRMVALSGTSPPGAPAGVFFNGFSLPTINNAGQTAFQATIFGTGTNTNNNEGIWSEGTGTLSLVARKGDTAPGAGVTFSTLSAPALNSAGQTAFHATLSSGSGIWSEGSGALALVARTGDAAPGTEVNFTSFNTAPVFNSAGQTAFLAQLTGTGVTTSNRWGIWSEGSGSLTLVARDGSPAPGGGNFRNLHNPVLNSEGKVAFLGGFAYHNDGIWSDRGGALEEIARVGKDAPSPYDDDLYSALTFPSINNAGQIAFRGSASGGPYGSKNAGNSLWTDRSGATTLLLHEGSPAPGTGVEFGGAIDEPVINGAGQVGFVWHLTGEGVTSANSTGLWVERDEGALDLVARKGSPAPGTEANFHSMPGNLALNSRGQVAFITRLTGAGVTSQNDVGIWAEDVHHNLRLIVRKGDVLEVSPGVFSTIRELGFVSDSGNEDGRRSGFNDRGQLTFYASFGGAYGAIFVTDLVAVTDGDFDFDSDVDGNDFLIWQRGESPNGLTAGDLTAWRDNFDVSSNVVATQVPEPAAIVLGASAVVAALGTATRKRLRRFPAWP